MGVNCEDVLREISNYVEGSLSASLKASLDDHIARCPKCAAVRDGMQNVVRLYADDRMFFPPAGYTARLHSRISSAAIGKRGSALGWMALLAAAASMAVIFLVTGARDANIPVLRSVMSQPTRHMPQGLVAVVDDGKTYHHPSCPFIHGHYHMIPAAEAVRLGYSPCIRCMKEALRTAYSVPARPNKVQFAESTFSAK